jgi:hypothetical protein
MLTGREHVCSPGKIGSDRRAVKVKEFFLLLSSTGLAYRRCKLVRVAGDQIGVAFLTQDTFAKKKAAKKRSTAQAV